LGPDNVGQTTPASNGKAAAFTGAAPGRVRPLCCGLAPAGRSL